MGPGTTLSADQKIERIARGREATMAAGLVRPFIEKKLEEVLVSLIIDYRNNELTHDGLVGGVAEISALRDLLDTMERVHKAGVAIMEREHAED